MSRIPVLFVVFNRPETTKKVFEAIRLYAPKRLYVAADGPRAGVETDAEKCRLTRIIIESIDWDCDIHRLYQHDNLGCNFGPRAAFKWFFDQEKEGIILEDDCLPHADFFSFAGEMLERFRSNQKIISINGSNLGFTLNDGNSYCFSRFMNMWGWATWADRAVSIDYSLTEWRKLKRPLWMLHRKMRHNLLDFDINWYRHWERNFNRTIKEKDVSWWDWQWIWNQIYRQQLSVIPAVNLISNIGFTEEGTHTHKKDNPAAKLLVKSLPIPLQHPKYIKPHNYYEEIYVKWVWCYHKRLPLIFFIKSSISRKISIFRNKKIEH